MGTAEAFDWLDRRLKEAAGTLQCLRLVRHDVPDGHGTHWPSVVRSPKDAYGYEGDPGYDDGDPDHPLITKDTEEQKRRREERQNKRVLAMQRSRIDRMLEALGWLEKLEPEERFIVWGRAEGRSWQELQNDRSIRTLQRLRDCALGKLLIYIHVR